MEIITSKVSVYEVELDLKQWDQIDSNDVPGFCETLESKISTIIEHKCMTGKRGGFLEEVRKGTNFAHVIEHVILELLHLADPEKEVYTGWTRIKGDNIFTIHYSAPNFITGRLAAILAVDLVKKLIKGQDVDLPYYIDLLRSPMKYFTHEGRIKVEEPDRAEPVGVIPEIQETKQQETDLADIVELTRAQEGNIALILTEIRKHINYIVELWKKSFFEYAGNFGRSIVDKIELINIDKFIDLLAVGDFNSFYRGIRKLSQVINSYRIPVHFVVHSIWMYKNNLFGFIIEEYGDRKDILNRAVKDFEDLYRVILKNVFEGYSAQIKSEDINKLAELKEFRELKKKKGSILVVDDDEMTRRVFNDILEYHGYRTITADSAENAIDILSDDTEDISLTILDMQLPGISGEEAYIRVRERVPNMGIIISSGYPLTDDLRVRLEEDNTTFIGKPFTAEKLLEQVKSRLKNEFQYIESDLVSDEPDRQWR